MTHVDLVVVGGGITGLAAAWEAVQQGAEVVVLEADTRPGGKLRTSPVAGIPVDESADAFLVRVPEAVDLCTEMGLGDQLVAPATGRAYLWVEGQLQPLPEAQLLGVPTDVEAVAATGILSPPALARVRSAVEGISPGAVGARAVPGDESVGAVVRRELGDEVLDRLVAPLVGGIWAGDCDRLSLEVATPALADARSRGPNLARGAASVRAAALGAAAANANAGPGAEPGAAAPGAPGPVFLAPRRGMGQLVDALATALGDRVRTGHRVTALEPVPAPEPGRWRVAVTRAASWASSTARDRATMPDAASAAGPSGRWRGMTPPASSADPAGRRGLVAGTASATGASRRSTGGAVDGRGPGAQARSREHRGGDATTITADAVVVTTPAYAAAPLVAGLSPGAAATLAAIDHASVALVTLAVPRDGVENPLDGSGFLVPPSAGRLLTACSWTSSKWPHLTGVGAPVVLLRASAGRDGDDRALMLDDVELVDAILADLADTMGLRATPVDVRVSRWWRSFPQPRPGHVARVAALEADLARDAPGVLVAGAWARGVGLPACIRAGRAATRTALAP